jgi:NAD+ diphosphatase
MNFTPATQPGADSQSVVYWLLFYEDQLLMETGTSDPRLLSFDKNPPPNFKITALQYLGVLEDKPCYTALLTSTANIPEHMSFVRVRDLYDKLPEDLFWLIGRAFHIAVWDRRTLYCGSCGAPTENMDGTRAKVCPKCHQLNFPRISPAIIVAIFKGEKILLARNRNLPADLFTVIAGFVEPGETLEECLQREVREEVGIAVKNIRYFSSQPWPFPDSLMIAFTAEYAGGDIQVDGEEIIEADWFSADHLPKVPGKVSVARKLIDWYQNQYPIVSMKK